MKHCTYMTDKVTLIVSMTLNYTEFQALCHEGFPLFSTISLQEDSQSESMGHSLRPI